MHADAQLRAVARLADLFAQDRIAYWLFGGWAVDFHAGDVTRAHDDVDVAVRTADADRVREVLVGDGWTHTRADAEDGYTVYHRGGVRLEVAFLEYGEWPTGSFADDVAELAGVRARVVSFESLKADKAVVRDDAAVAAKDRVDSLTLDALS